MKKEQPAQIQLELPDYSLEYEQYLRNKKLEEKKQEETVIIIDLY